MFKEEQKKLKIERKNVFQGYTLH